jgi:hypothetical protein
MAAGVVGAAGVMAFAAATASAQPVFPQPPRPPVTQPVTTAAPNGALAVPGTGQPTNQLLGVTSTTPALAPAQGGLTTAPVVAPQATVTPAAAGTLHDFFHEKGVTLEPQNSRDFKALNIVLPVPKGWVQVPDPNVPDAFAVIADRVGGNGLYSSNAQLVVYKLVGQFDPREAISHGFIDSQQLPAWRTTDGSLADFYGMPSAVIEGTYRENAMTLNTSRRHLIATAGPDNYLVSLSVTTSVDQVVAAADATDAIVRGFRVSLPAPAGAAPAVAPAPATTPTAPAAPVLPAATGLPAAAALGATTPHAGLPGPMG